MSDTLPDLRVAIAEGMEALARVGYAEPMRFHWDGDHEAILMRGAETLRWCAAREAPSIAELQAEIARLEDLIEAVDEACLDDASPTERLAVIRDLVA